MRDDGILWPLPRRTIQVCSRSPQATTGSEPGRLTCGQAVNELTFRFVEEEANKAAIIGKLVLRDRLEHTFAL